LPKKVRRKKIVKKLSLMAQIPANVLSKDEIFDDECIDEDNISNEKLE